ncbi:MAG: DUF938 domain-containing protein [Methylibium sp.]|uniref:DUF938 domain-containing protein n=1 Tax=Methylibium sp. TaxID=2067992 RepID=UPI0017AD3DB6|nr:DUF938 domain-containing protein [Methylibium sp.]MBA3598830.1 DUF938 domain-containing protein [Methylibium sp.]
MPSDDTLRHSPAAERNRQALLEALVQLLPPQGSALEIASGTGQHAVHFAAGLPGWSWQPSDPDPGALASIAAWSAHSRLHNLRAPLQLDVTAAQWPVEPGWTAMFCANLLHIAPWAACLGLMAGAARNLAPGGLLLTYGPYLVDDAPTAPSNLAFDADLRGRDPAWGLRRLADVAQAAVTAGMVLRDRLSMPANNLLLVFTHAPATPA